MPSDRARVRGARHRAVATQCASFSYRRPRSGRSHTGSQSRGDACFRRRPRSAAGCRYSRLRCGSLVAFTSAPASGRLHRHVPKQSQAATSSPREPGASPATGVASVSRYQAVNVLLFLSSKRGQISGRQSLLWLIYHRRCFRARFACETLVWRRVALESAVRSRCTHAHCASDLRSAGVLPLRSHACQNC